MHTSTVPTTYHAMLLRKHVHGATLTTAQPGLLPKQLCHHLTCRASLAEGMHVVTVGGAHIVILTELTNDTC